MAQTFRTKTEDPEKEEALAFISSKIKGEPTDGKADAIAFTRAMAKKAKESSTVAAAPTATPSTPAPSTSAQRTGFKAWRQQNGTPFPETPKLQYSTTDRYRPGGVYSPEVAEIQPVQTEAAGSIGRYRPSGVYQAEKAEPVVSSQPWDALYSSGAIIRGQELAAKETLTSEEKQEARALQREIDKVTKTREALKSEKYAELTDLSARLYSKSNWFAGFGAGVIQALGFDWLTDRTADIVEAVTGVKSDTGAQELTASAQKNFPIWNAVGNVAGSVLELGAISSAVGGALSKAKWFTNLAPWVQRATSSAITFGISGAANGVTEIQTKEEWDKQEQKQADLAASFGAEYTPREYNLGNQLAKVGVGAATGVAAGALGGALSSAFGAGTTNILRRYGLQYNTALRAIASGITGMGFAAGSTAAQEVSKYLQYPEGYTPNAAEIGTNLAIAFLFSTASSVVNDIKTAPANKEQILRLRDLLLKQYGTAKIDMANMAGDERIQAAMKAYGYSLTLRDKVLNSPGMSGVNEEIKSLFAALDMIDDQLLAIISGGNGQLGAADIFSEAGVPAGTPLSEAIALIGANVPAPNGVPVESAPIPQTAETATVPAWYMALINTPRPMDQPARQAPALTLPQPVQAPQEAQSASGAPTLPPQNIAPTESVPAVAPTGEAAPAPSAPVRSEELTPEPERGIVEENPAYTTDEGRELANALNAYNRIEHNGFEYTVNETSAGWIGHLLDIRDSRMGGMISNAMALDYQTSPMETRQEAVDTLIQVAERNGLLTQAQGPTPEVPVSEAPVIQVENTPTHSTKNEAPVITAEKPTEEKPSGKKPHEVLSESLIRYLDEGTTIAPQDLQRLAEEAFGGTRGSGAYDIKTAYDALELAVNKYLMNAAFVRKIGNGDVAAAELTEAALEKFMRLLPTQSVRTEEQQQFQQFSTPPNIAYLAAWAANISDADTVLEPSAGIGGLALWPKAWGATVYGNELSGRRAEILRSLGLDEVFTENAEQINNILPDYVKPSVVLMNPPFSATAGRTSTNKTANAKRHVEQALARLEDGGRLVAILGQGMANDSKTFAPWWNELRKKYDIRANLSINGENYRKYGTTFDVQLVVIDKTGPQTGETITGSYDDLTEIPQALEGIRSDRTQPEKRVDAAGERGVLASTGPERNGPVSTRPSGNPERPSGTASGNVRGEAPVLPGNGGRVQPGGAGENGLRLGGGENGSRVGGESSQNAGGVHPESQPERNAGPESELPVRGLSKLPAYNTVLSSLKKAVGKKPYILNGKGYWTENVGDGYLAYIGDDEYGEEGGYTSWRYDTKKDAIRHLLQDISEEYADRYYRESLPDYLVPKDSIGSTGGSAQNVTATHAEPAATKPKKTAASQQKAGNDDNVYAEYIPPKTPVKGTQKHPAKIVESAAMAAVDAPQASYTPNIPKELIASGVLSDVQLTNIVYAGQAHSQMIPSQNKRKGYFIGDGTGVGKGRQLAGIILDNFRQGRTKAVWISQRQNLYADARRDWQAMGMNPDDVISSQKVKATASIGAKSGIYFTTYDTLANKSKTGQSRIDQLVDWLGNDFDGVICFDEAHTMGNVLGKQSKMGKTKPAERALAGAKLQDMLPNARIVYASATMATNVDEMAFAERLGLWGPGTQFNNVRDFVEKISAGGMAAMELVARDMKAMGLYQARSISYDGVEYETLQHDLTPMQKDIYDTMSRAWQTTLQNMNEAMSITGANLNGRARAAAKSAYYGALQRFYNQVLTSMAVPSVIKDMKKELAKGRSVVLQIVNTNEAETERQLAKQKETGESLEDLDITPREALLSFFRNSFPVQAYETYTDENGNELSRPVVDSNGNPVEDREAVAMRDRMIREIEQMKVPEGPLEMIFDAFGTENVAEVTGRSRRVVPGRDEYGNTVKIEEKRGAKSGEADATAFQDGQKRILIFSDAGGTGKSYHADRTAKNQQQRVHYLLQPGWSAPKAVQGFGRTHRSNEASAPIYKLVTTDVKGQKRFVSTIARRLDQLGALTKGQRQTGSGMFSARDNLESDLATDSLYNFYRNLIDGRIEGLNAEDVLQKLGLYEKFYDAQARKLKVPDGAGRDMSLFLNRILALEYDEQNLVFDAFSRIFDDAYETALANGTLDMGMETVRADKINILDDLIVRTDENTGATTNYVQAKLSEKARILKTVDDLRNMRGDFIGLYRKQNGDVVGVFRTRDKTESDGSVSKQYILQTPLERKISRYVEKTLKSECTRIPEKEWDNAWAAEVEKAPEYIDTVKHMLTGSLLPVWNRLPKSGNVKVQRLIADDGRQYLGRIIDAKQIDDVLKSLGVSSGRTKQSYTVDDVIQRVYKNGDRATLEENRMALTRRRVGNEWRIEITGDNLYWLARNNPDIIQERINYKDRFFIPNGEKQRAVLDAILAQNPVRDIEAVLGDVSDSRDASNFNGNTAPRHPENWKAERVGDKDKTPMSGPDIVQMIRDKFGIPVTTGHIRSAEARAQYRKQPQTIRTKVANSIPDIGHELGHHLDNIFDIQHSISKEAKAEIVDAMPDSFKAKYKNKSEWPGEGVAEFMRRYLQNSETAAIDFPKFTEEFFNLLDKKTAAAVEQLADEVNAFYSLSEDTGNYPIHNYEDKGRDFRETDEKLRDMNTHIRMLFVDTNEPIRQIDRQTGDKVHMFATNAAYAENRAYMAITGDLFNLRGTEIIYDGLQTVLKDINMNSKREFTDFGWYLVCRHAPWRLKQGMRVTENDALDNTAYFEETKERLEKKYPQFEKTSDKFYEFIAAVLDEYGVKSGFYTKDVVSGWRERFGPYYVPLNRWFGDEKVRPGQGDKRSFANQTGIHGRAIGSGLDIINPVDNVIINTVRMVNAAIKNDVAQKLSESISRLEGGGYLMEKIPPTLARKTWDGKGLKAKTLDEFEKYFEQIGADFDPKLDDLFQKVLDNSIDDVLVQYGRGKASGDIITIMKNGEPEYWKVNDPYLLQSLTHMSSTDLGALLGYIGHVTRFITGNITGLNLAWSLGSNLPRDLGSVIVYSPDKNIFQILRYIGQFYGNKFRKKAKQTFEYKQFMALGGNSVTAMTSDVNMTKKARRDIQKRMQDWFIHPIETLEYFGNVIEGGTRYAVFVLCLHKGMTPEEAFYVAMESTVNFKRKGLLTPSLNVVIPFSGASIQGMDRLIRYFEAEDLPQDQRKGGRAKRIAIYLAVSLAIAAMEVAINSYTRRRRDNWEKLSVFTKNNYFTFPLPNGEHLSVPKPRENAIAISYFERLFELLVNKNSHAFDDFWEYVTDNTAPGVLSGMLQGDWNSVVGDLAIVGTVHYLTSNKDFLGRAIVPNSMIDLPKRDQYDQTTSKLAKLIGETLNWSPKKIDFFMNNTLAAFWKAQQSLAPVSGKTDLSLGVASKWVKDPLYSTDIPNRIYALRDKLKVEHNGNPSDMQIAARYRTVSKAAEFYGKYYKLAKNDEENARNREIRESVLDALLGVELGANNEKAYQFVLEVVDREGSTEYMPSVLEPVVKGDNGTTYSLNSEEYYMMQTRYFSLYYDYIRQATANRPKMSDEEKTQTVIEAKGLASDVARGEVIEAHGGTLKAYTKVKDLLEDDVDDGDLINFLAASSTRLADTDGSGSVSNAELLSAVSGLRLPSEDEVALTRYANPDLGLKLEVIAPYGVSAEEYSKVLEILGPGTPSQERAEAAIDEVYGRTTAKNKKEKAAVWQSLGKKWKTSNNPYDPNAGSKVQSGLVITAK